MKHYQNKKWSIRGFWKKNWKGKFIKTTKNPFSFGLYVHIPFCRSKCGYCDFNSYAGLEGLFDEYVSALKKEFEIAAENHEKLPLDTLYFGGGTPTLLGGERLAHLLRHFAHGAEISPNAEITVEANPGALTLQTLTILKEAGVNRLSLGVQSFQDSFLKKMGRVHSRRDVFEAIQSAREAGFHNLSLDLIFGLPSQTLADWERELETAFQFSPEHISAYQLTVEPGTEFEERLQRGRLLLPAESVLMAMHHKTPLLMAEAGYERYEISNYAKGNKYCLHNLHAWRYGEYLGLGAGAASFLDGTRRRNVEGVEEYIKRINENLSPVMEEERLEEKAKLAEIVMLGLRTGEGVDFKFVEKHTGMNIATLYPGVLSELERDGLLHHRDNGITLTEKGMLFSNEVFMRFMEP